MTKERFNIRAKDLSFASKTFEQAKRGIWPAGLGTDLALVWSEGNLAAMNSNEIDQLVRDSKYFEAVDRNGNAFDSVMLAEDFEVWRRCGEE